MSPQLSAALGFGIRELALAVVLVMSAAGALVLVGAAARGGRWRLLRPRRGTVSVGPWSPVAEGVRVLLDRGPARFRAESLTIVVENGGSLVIGAAGAADRSAARQVVVGRGGSCGSRPRRSASRRSSSPRAGPCGSARRAVGRAARRAQRRRGHGPAMAARPMVRVESSANLEERDDGESGDQRLRPDRPQRPAGGSAAGRRLGHRGGERRR